MPNYDYVCDTCGYEEEINQPMSDPPLEYYCPKCGEPIRRKIGTGAVVIFNGTGFYENDYKNKKP
jgi:putative FmdB family regulatory protein